MPSVFAMSTSPRSGHLRPVLSVYVSLVSVSLGHLSLDLREPLLAQPGQQGVERPLKHRGQVAVRDLVPQKLLSLAQFFYKRLTGGELNLVRLCRQW